MNPRQALAACSGAVVLVGCSQVSPADVGTQDGSASTPSAAELPETGVDPTTTSAPAPTTTEAPATTVAKVTVPTDPPTTMVVRPRPLPTTTLPEDEDEKLTDEEWYQAQPGYGPWSIPTYVVMCESGGSWTAQNASGAAGPYQLMPEHFGGESALNQSQAAQHAKAAYLWNGGVNTASGLGPQNWKSCL